MKINKNIQAISEAKNLNGLETAALQAMWRNRAKPHSLSVCHTKTNLSVDDSGEKQEITQHKIFIILNGGIVPVSRVVAKITGLRYNQASDSISINSTGIDANFTIAEKIYSKLLPKNSKAIDIGRLFAVQSVNRL
ncbi:MAG: hypothetical protein VYA60_11005 [Pseudomonadota bacterium]|nr:hypothetical protein [Pseudomonadota bacterium]